MSAVKAVKMGAIKTVAAVLGVAAVVAVVVVASQPAADQAADTPSTRVSGRQPIAGQPSSSSWSAAAPTADGAVCGLQKATKTTSAVTMTTTFSVPDGPQHPALTDQQVVWSATMHLEVLASSAGEAVALAALTEPSEALAASAGAGVSAPFLVKINDRCELSGFARHEDTAVSTARVQQSLLHELWFSVPVGADAALVQYANAMGRAVGTIQQGPGGDITRQLRSYDAVWADAMAGLRVVESKLVVTRGGRPWFDEMSGVEVFAAGALESGRVELSVVMAQLAPDALTAASHVEADYVWDDLLRARNDAMLAKKPANHDARVAAMADVTWPTALDQFLQRIETTSDFDGQWRDMSAFLDAHPEAITEYAVTLVTEFEPRWKAAGFVALGQTQHTAAREALLDIYRERALPPMDRVRSSLALATRHDVGVGLARELSAEVALRAAGDDRGGAGRQAMLHLGVLAGMHPDDSAVAAVVEQTVSSGLAAIESATTGSDGDGDVTDDVTTVFATIGNTGNAAFLPVLRSWSEHQDPRVRAAVAIGMRRMPVDQVRDFTLAWLRRETSFEVKQELFEVVHHQYTDAGRVIDDGLIAEAIAHLEQRPRLLTRQSLFRLLGPVVARHAGARAALRESIPLELAERSGLYSFLAGVLPAADVTAGLSLVDSLSDQVPQQAAVAPPPSPVVGDEASNTQTPPPSFTIDPPTALELGAEFQP